MTSHDLTPKCSWGREIPWHFFFSGKSRLVKYYNLARFIVKVMTTVMVMIIVRVIVIITIIVIVIVIVILSLCCCHWFCYGQSHGDAASLLSQTFPGWCILMIWPDHPFRVGVKLVCHFVYGKLPWMCHGKLQVIIHEANGIGEWMVVPGLFIRIQHNTGSSCCTTIWLINLP